MRAIPISSANLNINRCTNNVKYNKKQHNAQNPPSFNGALGKVVGGTLGTVFGGIVTSAFAAFTASAVPAAFGIYCIFAGIKWGDKFEKDLFKSSDPPSPPAAT